MSLSEWFTQSKQSIKELTRLLELTNDQNTKLIIIQSINKLKSDLSARTAKI